MAIRNIIMATALLGVCLASCTDSKSDKATPTTIIGDTSTHSKTEVMRTYVSMFEIPATDISRACDFYEALLGIQIERMEVEGMQMGIWPTQGQIVSGVLIQAGGYTPSAEGVTMYLNAGDNLQAALDQVEKHGGKVIAPKTAHADGSGFFAIFLDSEGNKMALNATN